MATDFLSVLGQIAPAVLNIGSNLYQSNKQQGALNDANDQWGSDMQAAAELMKMGYTQQEALLLAGISDMGKYLKESYGRTTDILEDGSTNYGNDLSGAVRGYGREMQPAMDQYGNLMSGNVEDYGNSMFDTMGLSDDLMTEGADNFDMAYAPYVEGGAQALDQMKQIAALDPNELTPSQRMMMENYVRDQNASFAASGLRGAGRAGVGALAEGKAKLAADAFDQNQRRADAALQTLSNQGYQATGQVASNQRSLGNQRSNMAYQTGSNVAGRLMDVGSNIADKNLGLASDIAGKGLTAKGQTATQRLNKAGQIADLTGKYYAGLGDYTGQAAGIMGNTAFQKAVADAGARSSVAQGNVGTAYNNAKISGQAMGNISNIVNNAAKGIFSNSNPGVGTTSTSNGWVDPDLPWLGSNPNY